MTILVTGASGHLGANLVRRLLEDGQSVRVLLRQGSNNAAVEGLDVEKVYGDLRHLDRIKTAVKGCDRIYHCAAKDIVEGHILAMKQGRPGQKYIFSSQFLTVDELMDMFEEITHRDRPSLRIPGAVMARVAKVEKKIWQHKSNKLNNSIGHGGEIPPTLSFKVPIPIEKNRYGRTVAEIYVKDSDSNAINLNVQMVRDGYAWHYERYSGSCPIRSEFAIAQEIAQKESLGIWNGNPQPPWEWRQANK